MKVYWPRILLGRPQLILRITVPKKVVRVRKDEHVRTRDEDEEMLLLDRQPGPSGQTQTQLHATQTQYVQSTSPSRTQKKKPVGNDSDSSATEPEDDEEEEGLLLDSSAARKPARSLKRTRVAVGVGRAEARRVIVAGGARRGGDHGQIARTARR